MKFGTHERDDFDPVSLTLESRREAALLLHVLISGRCWYGSDDPVRDMYYGLREIVNFDENCSYPGRSRDISNGLYRSD